MNDNDLKQRVEQNEEDVVELAISLRKMIDYMERNVQMVERLSQNVEELKNRVAELEQALAAKPNEVSSGIGSSLRRVQ